MSLRQENLNMENANTKPLMEMIRISCLRRFTSSIQNKEDLTTVDIVNKDDFLYGQWMALILLSGPALQITLKTHYYNHPIAGLVSIGLRKNADTIQEEMIMDFMREFCNLSAGEIKSNLLACGVAAGLSLPLITHGFDEVLFSDTQLPTQNRDWWAISWGGGRIVCSSEVEIFQPEEIAKIALSAPAGPSENDGDIDFL